MKWERKRLETNYEMLWTYSLFYSVHNQIFPIVLQLCITLLCQTSNVLKVTVLFEIKLLWLNIYSCWISSQLHIKLSNRIRKATLHLVQWWLFVSKLKCSSVKYLVQFNNAKGYNSNSKASSEEPYRNGNW